MKWICLLIYHLVIFINAASYKNVRIHEKLHLDQRRMERDVAEEIHAESTTKRENEVDEKIYDNDKDNLTDQTNLSDTNNTSFDMNTTESDTQIELDTPTHQAEPNMRQADLQAPSNLSTLGTNETESDAQNILPSTQKDETVPPIQKTNTTTHTIELDVPLHVDSPKHIATLVHVVAPSNMNLTKETILVAVPKSQAHAFVHAAAQARIAEAKSIALTIAAKHHQNEEDINLHDDKLHDDKLHDEIRHDEIKHEATNEEVEHAAPMDKTLELDTIVDTSAEQAAQNDEIAETASPIEETADHAEAVGHVTSHEEHEKHPESEHEEPDEEVEHAEEQIPSELKRIPSKCSKCNKRLKPKDNLESHVTGGRNEPPQTGGGLQIFGLFPKHEHPLEKWTLVESKEHLRPRPAPRPSVKSHPLMPPQLPFQHQTYTNSLEEKLKRYVDAAIGRSRSSEEEDDSKEDCDRNLRVVLNTVKGGSPSSNSPAAPVNPLLSSLSPGLISLNPGLNSLTSGILPPGIVLPPGIALTPVLGLPSDLGGLAPNIGQMYPSLGSLIPGLNNLPPGYAGIINPFGPGSVGSMTPGQILSLGSTGFITPLGPGSSSVQGPPSLIQPSGRPIHQPHHHSHQPPSLKYCRKFFLRLIRKRPHISELFDPHHPYRQLKHHPCYGRILHLFEIPPTLHFMPITGDYDQYLLLQSKRKKPYSKEDIDAIISKLTCQK